MESGSPVWFVYIGLLVVIVGVAFVVRPSQSIRRKRAAGIAAVGAGVLAAGAIWPTGLVVRSPPISKLDEFLPAYQFGEIHHLRINAHPDAVYTAIKEVTAGEIRLFRTLTWIRSPHVGATQESILAAPPGKPLLDVATRSGFLLLADVPNRELAFGTIGGGPPLHVVHPTPLDFLRFNHPGYAKIAMNFTIVPEADGSSTVATETRVYATDSGARRRFAIYWRVIAPGSALIRVMWLRAIKERAERQR